LVDRLTTPTFGLNWNASREADLDKLNFNNLQGVERTMLMTLFWRGMESEQSEPLIRDEVAARLLPNLEGEFSYLRKSKDDQLYNVLRTRQFDRWTRDFIAIHPRGTVVDLGCGLDARAQRIGGTEIHWFGVDLPRVAAFRKSVFTDPPRYTLIAGSVLDSAWMDRVESAKNLPYHFSAQGLLPYLQPGDVKCLVLGLRDRFPGCELVFDAMSPFMVRLHNYHPWVRKMNLQFFWGLKADEGFEEWAEGIKLESSWLYFDDPEPRMKPYRWMNFIPEAAKGNRVLKYRLSKHRKS
jgi:O-methyltransferase involved in polyketide biosynthesis